MKPCALACPAQSYLPSLDTGRTDRTAGTQLTDPPIITAVLSKYKYTVLTNNFPQKSDMDNQLLPASPTYTIKQQVENLWIQGIKLRHILQNAEICMYLLNALIPLLKEPLRFSKLLNKVKKHQKVHLKAKIRQKISILLVRFNVCEPYLLYSVID